MQYRMESIDWGKLRETLLRYANAHQFKLIDDNEDLVQDAIIKIIENLHQYDPSESEFNTWAVQILRNMAVSKKRQERGVQYVDYYDTLIYCESPNKTDDKIINDEIHKIIQQLIRELPNHARVLMDAYYRIVVLDHGDLDDLKEELKWDNESMGQLSLKLYWAQKTLSIRLKQWEAKHNEKLFDV